MGIFLQKSVMNSENTSIFETRVHNGPQCHPRSPILAKIESPYYLVIINNNLGGILPRLRPIPEFTDTTDTDTLDLHQTETEYWYRSKPNLAPIQRVCIISVKTALHSYLIRILGCSPCSRLRCWISEMRRP